MEFNSHPEKRLIDHLTEVTNLACQFSKGLYTKQVELAAKCHDFGKYTFYFQRHLLTGQGGNLSHHSYISAIFTAYVALKQQGEDNYLPLVLYSVVINHHSNVDQINKNLPHTIRFDLNDLDGEFKRRISAINKQLDDMEKNAVKISAELKKMEINEYFIDFLRDRPFEQIIKSLTKLYKLLERDKIAYTQLYTCHNHIYSCLVDGDKLSASQTPLLKAQSIPYSELLKIYRLKFSSGKGVSLKEVRTEIFQKVQGTLEQQFDKSRYFSVTSPTGSGKTLTGFYAAKKLQNLLGGERKVIYALPFTSIIDQNYREIEKLHLNFTAPVNMANFLLKHHHLSDNRFQGEDYNLEVDQAMLLTEGWHSGIIITTFIQLFETVIGYRNKMLKKYHNLKGAIILIDELQTIDIAYWPLMDYVLKQLCSELDCRVITMTATRPIILRDSLELLEGYEGYFKLFNRVKLIYHKEPMGVKDFTDNFIEQVEDKSYLIICNTIQQSLEVYEALKDVDKDVIYLSTNIIPKERRERIEYIREIMKDKPIVVSTQVVEAGVDLDFDVIYRDIAPIDSIIQGAGRCNRNNSKEKGIVNVVKLENKGRFYGSTIYGKMAILITDELLGNKSVVEEKEFLALIQEYFKMAMERMNTTSQSKEIIEGINYMDMEKVKGFQLIKGRSNYYDAFIEVDEYAKNLFQQYKEILESIYDPIEKKNKLMELRPKMAQYILSVPEKIAIKELIMEETMFRMDLDQKDRMYRDDTGLNRLRLDETIIF